MTETATGMAQAYHDALREYLAGGGEAALARAHELGRRAILDGVGLLDMVALHHEACRRAAPQPSDRAFEFLAECLAPYEMAQKGFKESLEMTRLKTQMVSLVSHEFANGLSVLQCALVCLEAPDSDTRPAERRRLHRIMRSNIRGMALASTNLLSLGRLEAGKFKLKLRPTRVRALLKESLRRLEHLSRRKKLSMRLDVPKAPLDVQADPEALTFVLSNLLSNAVKYTPNGGAIRAGLRADAARPGQAELFVQDSGIGISEEDREKVFRGFYRTDQGRRSADGFGVGLALAHKLVEAHGSRLELESEPGKGSRFFFRLPLWPDEGRQIG